MCLLSAAGCAVYTGRGNSDAMGSAPQTSRPHLLDVAWVGRLPHRVTEAAELGEYLRQ